MKYFGFLIISLFSIFRGFSQENTSWKNQVGRYGGFVQNLERFKPVFDKEVLFYTKNGDVTYFLTNSSIVVGTRDKLSGAEVKERMERKENDFFLEDIGWNYFEIAFTNANQSVQVSVNDKLQHTVNFQNRFDVYQTIKSPVFKGLTFENIYPNIDLAFSVPDAGGVKYTFYVKPGGDPNDIEMKYSNASLKLDSYTAVSIESDCGSFKDKGLHVVSNGNEVDAKFVVDGPIVSFDIGDYDTNNVLVVDPWLVTDIFFTTLQAAYDVAGDFAGNCAVMGDRGNEVCYYDNLGVLQWIWTSPGYMQELYGGFDMNPDNGHSYYTFYNRFLGVPDLYRLDKLGAVSETGDFLDADGDPSEIWRLSYNRVKNEVVVGAGGFPADDHINILDADLDDNEPYASLPPIGQLNDVTLLEVDPLGEYIYFLTSLESGSPGTYANNIYKVSHDNPLSILWEASTDHTFQEVCSVLYMSYWGAPTDCGRLSPNGYNGLACGFYLYSYDGKNIYRWDKDTGALLGTLSYEDVSKFTHGGISRDPCGKVYVGKMDSLLIYTPELDFIEGYELPDSCFDVRVTGEHVYATGADFVEKWDLDLVSLSLNEPTSTTCGACDGTASAEYSSICPELVLDQILWLPSGEIGVEVEGLCAGWQVANARWVNTIGDTIRRVDSVFIAAEAPGSLEFEAVNPSCSGACDGGVEITVSTGVPPYSYSLSGDINDTGIYSDLCSGVYEIIVTDGDGCTFIDVVELEETDPFLVNVLVQNEACGGVCNGAINLTPVTGDPPFVYGIGGGVTNAVGIFNDLCPDTYEIEIVDANGCIFRDTVTILANDGLGLMIESISHPTCYGFSDGSVSVVPAGVGVPPITYTWTPENPVDGNVFNTMSAGTYTVHGEDSEGCEGTLEIIIENPDSLYATYSVIEPLCFGETGILIIDSVYNAQNDLNNVSFFLAPNPTGIEGVGADSIPGLPAGNYTLTVNDDNGCSYITDFNVDQPNPLKLNEFGFDPALCRISGNQNGNGTVFASATGGAPDYTFLWTNLTTGATATSSTWGALNPGSYEVTVSDKNGCILKDQLFLDSLNVEAKFTVESAQLDANCEGTEVVVAQFINQSTGYANENSTDVVFSWNLDTDNADWYITDDILFSPDTVYNGEAIYEVCLNVSNKNNCISTVCKDIIVHVKPVFVAPNIFSPDNDDVNDLFTFEYRVVGIQTFHCVIVNRWGVKVGVITDISSGWDGLDLKGAPCAEGVYFYTYEAVSTNGTEFNGQGNVQLIRD